MYMFDTILFPEGVMKSAIGELTDSTNRAEVFGLIPVVWAAGATLGYHICRFSTSLGAEIGHVGL